jgi:hypothetical protein
MKNNLWPDSPLYDKYCIEPHGNAQALYFGRSNQSHGLRLCNLSDFDLKKESTIKNIESCVNEIHLIEFFASKEIYISIVPDGFMRSYGCCWRPIINYKDKDGKWREEDMGCPIDRKKAIEICFEFCESVLRDNQF